MKNIKFFLLLFVSQFFLAQNVYLSKVVKSNENSDKQLYSIKEEISLAEYLGEVDVQGFSNNDADIFSKIYKKAKEIGANAIALKPIEDIDGSAKEFNASNYKLSLYYLPKEKISASEGSLYVFASSSKDQKISINKKDYILPPRTYTKLQLAPGEIYTISTKKLLGSTIKIKKDNNNSDQYFQVSATKLGGNNQNDGTLHLKSGDIIGLEKSYAQFLKLIYQQNK